MNNMLTFKQFVETNDFGSYGLDGEWEIVLICDHGYWVAENDDFDGELFISLDKAEQYLYTRYVNNYALTEGY